jgi:hypothetical protein
MTGSATSGLKCGGKLYERAGDMTGRRFAGRFAGWLPTRKTPAREEQ